MGEQKAPRLQQGSFAGNQTLLFCAVAETEALVQCVGQMVGAGGAHWPLCAAADPSWTPLRPQSLTWRLQRDACIGCRVPSFNTEGWLHSLIKLWLKLNHLITWHVAKHAVWKHTFGNRSMQGGEWMMAWVGGEWECVCREIKKERKQETKDGSKQRRGYKVRGRYSSTGS